MPNSIKGFLCINKDRDSPALPSHIEQVSDMLCKSDELVCCAFFLPEAILGGVEQVMLDKELCKPNGDDFLKDFSQDG